jgi:hypothetical protein
MDTALSGNGRGAAWRVELTYRGVEWHGTCELAFSVLGDNDQRERYPGIHIQQLRACLLALICGAQLLY